jgi:hypothetical protein
MSDHRLVSTQLGQKVLRQACLTDWQEINALHRWAWFPERSEAGWRWMFALAAGTPGWVLEDEQGLCGFLGNVVQSYCWTDGPRQAATGYSLIVLPRARGGSSALLEAFQRQPEVFATSIFNGNGRSAEVYPREGFSGFPPGWADAKIVWPLRPFTIAAERVAWRVLGGRRPDSELFRSRQATISLRDPRIVLLDPWRDAAALNSYWGALAATGRLLATRSAQALQRRFSDPDRTREPILLGYLDGGELIAASLAQMGKMSELEAPILDVIDLTWLRVSSLSAPCVLLAQMRELALDFRASRLRLPLVNAEIAAVAAHVEGALVRRRHLHAHVFFQQPEFASAWSPTPFDGDYGFALRPEPKKRSRSLGIEASSPGREQRYEDRHSI